MKLTFGLFAGLVFVLGVNAQTRQKPAAPVPSCTISSADAPKLRGFQMGQTVTELLERLPQLKDAYLQNKLQFPQYAQFGMVMVFDSDMHWIRQEELADVEFTLNFLDEKLYFIQLKYREFEPDNLKYFIDQVSKTTPLANATWKISNPNAATIECKDFIAQIWTGKLATKTYYRDYPTFTLMNTILANEYQKRSAFAKEKAEQEAAAKVRAEQEKKRLEELKKKTFKP